MRVHFFRLRASIICFDIDGVVCKNNNNDYSKSIPLKKNIKKINELYDNGYYIKLFTARYMGRSQQKVSVATRNAKKITLYQLKSWNLKYNEVIFGKPSYDYFVDDKNFGFKKNWANLISKELKKLK